MNKCVATHELAAEGRGKGVVVGEGEEVAANGRGVSVESVFGGGRQRADKIYPGYNMT